MRFINIRELHNYFGFYIEGFNESLDYFSNFSDPLIECTIDYEETVEAYAIY